MPNKPPLPTSGHCVLGQIIAFCLVHNIASGFLWFSVIGFLGCSKPHTILLTSQERLLLSTLLGFRLGLISKAHAPPLSLLLRTAFHACPSPNSAGRCHFLLQSEDLLLEKPALISTRVVASLVNRGQVTFSWKETSSLRFLTCYLDLTSFAKRCYLFFFFSGPVLCCSVHVGVSHHCLRKKPQVILLFLCFCAYYCHLIWAHAHIHTAGQWTARMK